MQLNIRSGFVDSLFVNSGSVNSGFDYLGIGN
jgi:hypothetical protein